MADDAAMTGGLRHPTQARARLGLAVLAFLFAGIILLLAGFSLWLKHLPVFGPNRNLRWASTIDRLPVVDVLLVKYGHALHSPRFRYGLFGNSRAVGVSHRDLGLPEAAFFNFAVGGTSFRQSVAMVQMLHDAGKLPDTVIISLDNHDINFFGHAYWPGLIVAPGYHFAFMRDVYERQPSAVLMAKIATETFLVSMRAMVAGLNVGSLMGQWDFVFGNSAGNLAAYGPDGARRLPTETVAVAPAKQNFQKYTPLWPGMAVALEADLIRLGRLAAGGTRIVVYESPILPRLAGQVAGQRDAATAGLRKNFQTVCRMYGVTCLEAPTLTGDDTAWTDCCHAPPALLGRYIAGLL